MPLVAHLKSTSWLLLVKIVRNLSQVVFIAVLARALGQDDVGHYALGLAIVAPIFVVAEYGARTLYLTYKQALGLGQLLLLTFVTYVIGILLAVSVSMIFFPSQLILIVLIALIRISENTTDLVQAPLQLELKFFQIASISIPTSVLSISAGSFVLLTGGTLLTAVSAVLFFNFSIGVLGSWLLFRRYTPQKQILNKAPLVPLLLAGLPLALGGGMGALLYSVPQYFLFHEQGPAAEALFSVVFYLFAGFELLIGVISQVWLVSAKRIMQQSGEQALHVSYSSATLKITIGTLISSLFAVLTMWWIYPILLGPQYQINFLLGAVLVIGSTAIPGMIFVGAFSTLTNKYSALFVGSLIAVLVSSFVSVFAVPLLGVAGAFVAILFAYLARFIAITIYNRIN
jgi:O-antigen/teichoic acid export membrane protein